MWGVAPQKYLRPGDIWADVSGVVASFIRTLTRSLHTVVDDFVAALSFTLAPPRRVTAVLVIHLFLARTSIEG
jgi:hypothetical protein